MRGQLSIRAFLFFASTVLIVATMGLVLLLIQQGVAGVRGEYLKSLETRTDLFRDGIRESLLSGDYPTVVQKSRLLSVTEDVLAVRVLLRDGSEVAGFGRGSADSVSARFGTRAPVDIDGAGFAVAEIDYDLRRLGAVESGMFARITVIGGFILIGLALFLFVFSRQILRPLLRLREVADTGSFDGFAQLGAVSSLVEISSLQRALAAMAGGLRQAEQTRQELAVVSALAESSRQVAHDIRSPLTALKFMAATEGLPEERRLLIQRAVERINEIANGLLQQGKEAARARQDTRLAETLETLVLEKKFEYRERAGLVIALLRSEGDVEGLRARINPAELAPVLSNLLNNAIEALAGRARGSVSVRLTRDADHAVIEIQDDGIGMSEDVLARVGAKGFSHGKDGSGLGLAHAIATVRGAGGRLDVESAQGEGTRVILRLPLA